MVRHRKGRVRLVARAKRRKNGFFLRFFGHAIDNRLPREELAGTPRSTPGFFQGKDVKFIKKISFKHDILSHVF